MNGIYILIILLIYFGILLTVSKLTAHKGDNDTFFRGNHQSRWYLVAFGMIGSSLSGVSFVSVPGWVGKTDMTYMQMVFGFFFGYLIVAYVLLPLYYRLHLTSIYTYLDKRFGRRSYKTGASFFLLSRMAGTAAKQFLVCMILQKYVFEQFHVPFLFTVCFMQLLIWLYTRKGGIRTIVWTDTLQTFCLIASLCLIFFQAGSMMHLDLGEMWHTIQQSPHSRIFVLDDWSSPQHFLKQFVSGIFIVIVMTGLDQDMMQKNLTCRNLQESQKNMCCYGLAFIPINFIFLGLGILLIAFSTYKGIALPSTGDDILPTLCTDGSLGFPVLVLFTIGIIAAAFANVDSALAAMTTSFCIDILGIERTDSRFSHHPETIRKRVHLGTTLIFIFFILLFKIFNHTNLIDAVYIIASYTYGPLLGLFAFGLTNRLKVRDKFTPYIAIAAPVLCYLLEYSVKNCFNYKFGYELLIINGLLMYIGLWCFSYKENKKIKYLDR